MVLAPKGKLEKGQWLSGTISVPGTQKGDSVWLQVLLGQYLAWAEPRAPHPLMRGVCTYPQVRIYPELGRSFAALGAPRAGPGSWFYHSHSPDVG